MSRPANQTYRTGTWRAAAAAAILLVLIAGAVIAIKLGRYHLAPRRFAVVEPGALYRSGYCEPGPLEDVIRRYGIRTILVLLTNEPDARSQQQEEEVARRQGVELIRMGMPGDGRGDFELIDRAVEVIADASKRPLLVHCWAGVQRTGIVYAAWRMKYCGWDDQRALAEAAEHGYSPARNPALGEHLRDYASSRGLIGGHGKQGTPATQGLTTPSATCPAANGQRVNYSGK